MFLSTHMRIKYRIKYLDVGLSAYGLNGYEREMSTPPTLRRGMVDFTFLRWHIIGHFGDESFQTVTCTDTDNSKHTGKIHQKHKIDILDRDKDD